MKREKIIEYVLDSTAPLRVREVAIATEASAASASIVLNQLEEEGIVVREDNAFYTDLTQPITRAEKFKLNVEKLIPVIDVIRSKLKVTGIGIYGSWREGKNTERSDLDIWVKPVGKPSVLQMANLSSALRDALGVEVNILPLTAERLNSIKKEDPQFYSALLYSSFVLWGDGIG